jgi:transcriptional regulator with XRE-family HTH domain
MARGRKQALTPNASPLHFFGSEVRHAREAAGMTLNDLGAMVPCDPSTVSRVESGILAPDMHFAEVCDEAFPSSGGMVHEVLQREPGLERAVRRRVPAVHVV